MYRVSKDGNLIVIVDWKGNVVYSVDPDSIVVYEEAGKRLTAKVGSLSDEKLLLALTNSVKLPF